MLNCEINLPLLSEITRTIMKMFSQYSSQYGIYWLQKKNKVLDHLAKILVRLLKYV